MNRQVTRIILPTRPQPDTLGAIFLLKKFGGSQFVGIEDATVEIVQSSDSVGDASDSILLDIGGGEFDHHDRNPKTTTSQLVAEYLGVSEDSALTKLLAYTQRDDFFGRGTISPDPLDRAFGLSALVAALNKQHPKDPQRVVDVILPIFEAHYHEEKKRTDELPREMEEKRAAGDVHEFEARWRGKKIQCIMVRSDNPSLAGYLRSQLGGKFDIVLQRSESGYTNILTRPAKHIDLRLMAALIRIREGEYRQIDMPDSSLDDLMRTGRHPKIGCWYYDRATNSIQNGGLNPKDVEPTAIPWEEFEHIITDGLQESAFGGHGTQ